MLILLPVCNDGPVSTFSKRKERENYVFENLEHFTELENTLFGKYGLL